MANGIPDPVFAPVDGGRRADGGRLHFVLPFIVTEGGGREGGCLVAGGGGKKYGISPHNAPLFLWPRSFDVRVRVSKAGISLSLASSASSLSLSPSTL